MYHEILAATDFDPQRIQQVTTELDEDQRVFIDPANPDYMARKNEYFIKIIQDETGRWDHADNAYDGLGSPVTEVEQLTQLTEGEIQLLRGCGLETPERSAYHVVEETSVYGNRKGVSYNYTRLVEGDLLNPNLLAHTPFALAYARAAINYLAAKAPGDLMLGDLYARNCMVGIQQGMAPDTPPGLFFVDTEPFLEPVSFGKRGERIDNLGRSVGPFTEPSHYGRHLLDVLDVLERIPAGDREVKMEVATLLHKTSVLLHKCDLV